MPIFSICCLAYVLSSTNAHNNPPPGVHDWGAWNPCSTTCGDGLRHRVAAVHKDFKDIKPYQVEKCSTGKACTVSGKLTARNGVASSISDGEAIEIRTNSRRLDHGEIANEAETTDFISHSSDFVTNGSTVAFNDGGETEITTFRNSQTGSAAWSKVERLEIGPGESGVKRRGYNWGQWSGWSACTLGCSGTQERYHQCLNRYNVYDYLSGCTGAAYEIRACVNCGLGEISSAAVNLFKPGFQGPYVPGMGFGVINPTAFWSGWNSCSVSCGQGIRSRTRQCSLGDNCQGYMQETKVCHYGTCFASPIGASAFGKLGVWSGCSLTCGLGTRTRHTGCVVGTAGCLAGSYRETQTCNAGLCPAVAFPALSSTTCEPWTGWSGCTAVCGSGKRSRTRACRNYRLPASNVQLEEQACAGYNCGVIQPDSVYPTRIYPPNVYNPHSNYHPQPFYSTQILSQWGPWGSCSASCGEGVRSHTRICDPRVSVCRAYQQAEAEPCNLGSCVVYSNIGIGLNSGWGSWSPWGQCGVSCGTGIKIRQRNCFGDRVLCSGPSRQETYCTGQYFCPVTAGQAVSFQTFKVYNPAHANRLQTAETQNQAADKSAAKTVARR